MTYPIGGRLYVGYSNGSRDFELAVSLAPFDPSSFVYTAGGFALPTEADVGQTYLALAAVMAPYYDSGWYLSLKSVWAPGGADGAQLATVPTTASVIGTSITSVPTDPPLMRGFTFFSALGNRLRVRLFAVATNHAGNRRTVTPTMGGFDDRDQNLLAYLSGLATGLRCWDGVPFPSSARAYVRSMQPLAGGVGTGLVADYLVSG